MEYNIIEWSMLGTALLLLSIQLGYYLGLYNRLQRKVKKSSKEEAILSDSEYPPLSVIITIKGDALTLIKNLPTILEQDYPTFEVIVIYDKADEDCSDTLKLLQSKYPHLYYSFISKTARYISRKKLGVTTGVKASHHEWLVFTEADCQPKSNRWLRSLAVNFTPTTDIVLGYSNYERKKGWFNKTIIYDTLLISMRYLGMGINNATYMGRGRNLAYRKSMFYKHKGFAAQLKLERGEDDLFINQYATKQNTRVATHPDSFITINHPSYKRNWRSEKTNYAITSHHFKGTGRYVVGFESTTRLLFFMTLIAAIAHAIYYQQWLLGALFAACYFIRYLAQILVFTQSAKRLGTPVFYLTLPLLELIQPLRSFRYKCKRKMSRKKITQH